MLPDWVRRSSIVVELLSILPYLKKWKVSVSGMLKLFLTILVSWNSATLLCDTILILGHSLIDLLFPKIMEDQVCF